MSRELLSSRCLRTTLHICVLLGVCNAGSESTSGTDASTGAPSNLGDVNGRTLTELCQTLCDHAGLNGCDGNSLFPCGSRSSNCIDMFVTIPTCHEAWMKAPRDATGCYESERKPRRLAP